MIFGKLKGNKRGQAVVVGMMVAVMVFIIAVVMIAPIKEVVVSGRADIGCQYTNLTTGERGACILIDLYLPYFFGVVMAVGLGYIGGRAVMRLE